LQHLTLRFRDAQNATSWFNLARIDVAEWEGRIAGLIPSRAAIGTQAYEVRSHYGGKFTVPKEVFGGGFYGPRNIWYRGPKNVDLLNSNGISTGSTAQIGDNTRYPLFIFSGSSGVAERLEVSDPVAFPDKGTWYKNSFSKNVAIEAPSSATIGVGTTSFVPFPTIDPRNDFNMAPILFTYQGEPQGDPPKPAKRTLAESMWRYVDGTSGRYMSIVEFYSEGTYPQLTRQEFNLQVPAKIVPYTAGTLEYAGLPRDKGPEAPLLAMASQTWHKFILKIGPDAAAVSIGIEITLIKGDYPNEGSPQPGFEILGRTTSGFATLALNAEGKIMLAPGSVNYQKITSLEGLELYMRRSVTVTEPHKLKIQLTPKPLNSDYGPAVVAQSTLLPVDIQQENYDPSKGVRFCRWLDAFNPNFNPQFANTDRDRFRIRIPKTVENVTKMKIQSFGLRGAMIDGAFVQKTTDGDYEVDMIEENGAMFSKPILLVSDGDDDQKYNGEGTDDGKNDQTLMADFGSKINVSFPELGDAQVDFQAQNAVGRVTLRAYYYSPAGDLPVVMKSRIDLQIRKMREIYRQIGIQVAVANITGEVFEQIYFDPRSAPPPTGGHPEQDANVLDVFEGHELRTRMGNLEYIPHRIRIAYVNTKLYSSDGIVGGPTNPGARGWTMLGEDRILVSLATDNFGVLGVTAHEVGHALQLQHVPSNKNLMYEGAFNWRNDDLDSKRFDESDSNYIKGGIYYVSIP
jgi:hypothetical protein